MNEGDELRQMLFAEADRVLRPAISKTAERIAEQLSELLGPDIERAFETLEPVEGSNVEAVVTEAIRRVAALWSDQDIRIVIGNKDFTIKGFSG